MNTNVSKRNTLTAKARSLLAATQEMAASIEKTKIKKASEKDEEITRALQTGKAEKSRDLAFYKHRIQIPQDQELRTMILAESPQPL